MAENPGVYPKTSTPTQVDLYHFFLPYAKAGEQVLYFNLTAKFSSSYQSITLIAEELMEEYPACKIIVVDSYSATVQEGLLVTDAGGSGKAHRNAENDLPYFLYHCRPFLSAKGRTRGQGDDSGGKHAENQAHDSAL